MQHEIIQELLPKFPLTVDIVREDLVGKFGQYCYRQDKISISEELSRDYPDLVKVVLLHEALHSTGRYRKERLEDKFGRMEEGSIALRMEECITEISCRIILNKHKLLNRYSELFIDQGIKENYNQFMVIPWSEIIGAVHYYSEDDATYLDEYREAKKYYEDKFKLRFVKTYEEI